MRAAIILADGFEEIEAITPVDILRRAELDVSLLGLSSLSVCGCHQLSIQAEAILNTKDPKDFDILILPGGLPGAHNLRDNELLQQWILHFHQQDKLIAAICAAPVALLSALGEQLKTRKLTSHPSKRSELADFCDYQEQNLVRDGRLLTASAAGIAIDFSLEILKACGLQEKADAICSAIQHK